MERLVALGRALADPIRVRMLGMLADASSVVIAERVLDDLAVDQPAVAEVEVGEVDPKANLVVRVHVTDAGRPTRDVEAGDLVSTQSHPVLTHGHGDSVVVRPRVVGS